MAASGHSFTKIVVRPNRNYDYIYDPNFHLSSERDHAKETYKAQSNIARLHYMPLFKSMFSSLQHYPHQKVLLNVTEPLPPHMSRQWRGYVDQARETIIRYKKFNYDPSVSVPVKHFPPAEIRGRKMYQYFFRPTIPFMAQVPPNVVLASTRVDPLIPPLNEVEKSGGIFSAPRKRSVYVQTDYRDGEAQTDPFTPEPKVCLGPLPEAMTIAALCWGHGLPAGLAEVEMIERARIKRQWEASLPSPMDEEQANKRRKMMEEQERMEWAFRESELEKLKEERQEVLQEMLEQNDREHEELFCKWQEHLWSRKQAEKDREVGTLHSSHLKALRRLSQQSSNVEKKFLRRNIIHDYTHFDSQVYAPMNRAGVYLDAHSEKYSTNSKYCSTLDGLLELESTLPWHHRAVCVEVPDRKSRGVGLEARKRQKLRCVLDQVHSDLINVKIKDNVAGPLRLLERVEKHVPRPPTPTVFRPGDKVEEEELAVIMLQKIIRGRALQTKIFDGKEQHKQLIQELRTTHALQPPEQKLKATETKHIMSKQTEQKRTAHKEGRVQEGAEGPAAFLLGQQLDFLNKELVRIQEERRVSAFVMLAERQRRMREAEEGGWRQHEEHVRRVEDEVFKQMMRVHQGSVDTYLEDVILSSVSSTADQQAREAIAKKADTINKVADKFMHTELSGKELAAEMVHTFLLPEVDKEILRHRVRQDQRKHLLAAHRIVHEGQRNALQGLTSKK